MLYHMIKLDNYHHMSTKVLKYLNMKVVILLVLPFLVWCDIITRDTQWHKWKIEHGKQYSSHTEENKRRNIWEANFDIVDSINRNNSFKASLNHLADKLAMELVKSNHFFDNDIEQFNHGFMQTVPKSFDWRDHGVISPVKNQGQCGNVEAIVITECVASFHAIHTGQLLDLSVQQVADCCCKGGGCAGGYCPHPFMCIHKLGGLCSEHDYPPHPQKQPCKRGCKPVAQVHGGRQIPKGNETSLLLALLHAPVFVAIDASHQSFQLYKSGIYEEPSCSTTLLDHALQLVGYGTKDGQDFWICKNSWGINWGMHGYVLMARNHHNMCGIATSAIVPV